MNTITDKLTKIKGIGKNVENRLLSNEISDLVSLRKKTQKPEERDKLAQEIKVQAQTLYRWSKQADLMRVDGIDTDWAELLIRAGIRNVGDLAEIDEISLKKLLDVYSKNYSTDYDEGPDLEKLKDWKLEASKLENTLQLEPDDPRLDLILKNGKKGDSKKKISYKESSLFGDLSDIITNIGRGIAEAQVELDRGSLEVQKVLDEDEDFAGYGLKANWYVMPETTFTLKMEYTVVEEKESEGSGPFNKKIFISPINAKYQNYFKSTESTESEFKFKIVPVPPPTE